MKYSVSLFLLFSVLCPGLLFAENFVPTSCVGHTGDVEFCLYVPRCHELAVEKSAGKNVVSIQTVCIFTRKPAPHEDPHQVPAICKVAVDTYIGHHHYQHTSFPC